MFDKFVGYGGGSEFFECVFFVVFGCVDCNFFDFVYCYGWCFFEVFDDDLWVDFIFNMFFDFFEDFVGENNDGGSIVIDFGVLWLGNIDEDVGGGVDNV